MKKKSHPNSPQQYNYNQQKNNNFNWQSHIQPNLYSQPPLYPYYSCQHPNHYYLSHMPSQQNNYDNAYKSKISGYKEEKITDPRLRKREITRIQSEIKVIENKTEPKQLDQSSESEDHSSSQDEEQSFRKKKIIKKHPVFDSPQQVKKWVAARKKNYPKISYNKQQASNKQLMTQISLLESKLRKKISLLNSDPRSILKKVKTMDILRKILSNKRFNPNKRLIKQYNLEKKSFNLEKNIEQKPDKKNLYQNIKYQQAPDKIQIQEKQEVVEQVEESQNQIPIQHSIPKEPIILETPIQQKKRKPIDLQPEQIIEHLKQRQKEDKQLVNSLLQYKSNSFTYKYACRTLETNFQLEDIFKESIYMLQAIRYIVNNNFLEKQSGM